MYQENYRKFIDIEKNYLLSYLLLTPIHVHVEMIPSELHCELWVNKLACELKSQAV